LQGGTRVANLTINVFANLDTLAVLSIF